MIGNGRYAESPLKNPDSDARLMAETLTGLGFEVMLYLDQDLGQMKRVLRAFADRLAQTGGTGLFYFSGHGYQIDGENYLIPIGADIRRPDEIEHEAFALGRVLGKMRGAGNTLNLVILDACRNNPFRTWFRGESRGLASARPPAGTLVAYATQPDNFADDGEGANSPFTRSLARHIRTPGLPILTVLQRVTAEVARETKSRQIPWMEGAILEPLVLVPAARESTVTWHNPTTGNSGSVTSGERYCREYQQTVTVNGKSETQIGVACREPDGTWKVVQTNP